MLPDEGLGLAELIEIKKSMRELVDLLDRATVVPPPTSTNTNTNIINVGSLLAAWICSICCAIVLTVVILSRLDQVDQGRKIERVQDHETVILQYAPQWLRDKVNEVDKGKK